LLYRIAEQTSKYFAYRKKGPHCPRRVGIGENTVVAIGDYRLKKQPFRRWLEQALRLGYFLCIGVAIQANYYC
jgi:hypothetical protein